MSELTDALDLWDRAETFDDMVNMTPIVEAARRVADLQTIVDEQAEDEGLWFHAITASEAYLQQELRRLHAVIEGTALDITEDTDG